MNFYYIEVNKNDPKNRTAHMLCCREDELKTRLEDEFECINAINQGDGKWLLKGLDRLSQDCRSLQFDEEAIKPLHITKLTQKELENMFYNNMISVHCAGKASSIFAKYIKGF